MWDPKKNKKFPSNKLEILNYFYPIFHIIYAHWEYKKTKSYLSSLTCLFELRVIFSDWEYQKKTKSNLSSLTCHAELRVIFSDLNFEALLLWNGNIQIIGKTLNFCLFPMIFVDPILSSLLGCLLMIWCVLRFWTLTSCLCHFSLYYTYYSYCR